MNKLSQAVLATSFAVGLLSGCVPSTPMSPRGQRPTYAVYEVEIQSAREIAGHKFRIAVINGYELGGMSTEVWFAGANLNQPKDISDGNLGYDGLNYAQRRTLVTNQVLPLTSSRTDLVSIFSNRKIEISALGARPAEFTVKLIKSCDARAELDEYTTMHWGGSGVIAIPNFKKHDRLSIARPNCFAESDRIFDLGQTVAVTPEVAKQIMQAQAETAKADAKAEREKSRTNLMLKLTNEKLAEARALAKASPWKWVDNPRFEDKLRNAICPETIALARVSHIKGLTTDRTESARKDNADGSYSVTHESSITLEFEDGRKEKLTVALGNGRIVEGLTSLRVRTDGCADVKAKDARTSDEDEIVRDSAAVLKNHFTRQIENTAYEIAHRQIPAD